MSIVSNTTVLSNFASVHALEALRALHGSLFLTTEVYREIQRGLEEGYSFYSEVEKALRPNNPDGWLVLTSLESGEEVDLFAGMPARLHAGEASCLAVAQCRSWLFLTDDKAARRLAVTRGVEVSGSLGCLILGIERNLWTLDHANKLLDGFLSLGFRSPTTDLSDLVKRHR